MPTVLTIPIRDLTASLRPTALYAAALTHALAREDPTTAARIKAELSALVSPTGPSDEMLEAWRSRFPPPGAHKRRSTP